MRFAGLRLRLAALMLDSLVFIVVFFPITRLVKGVWLMSAAEHTWSRGLFVTDPLCIAFLAVMCAYFVFFEGVAGATPGKKLVGIRVERAGGGRPGLKRALVRNLLRVVDGLPVLGIVGVILIATSPERARFGDRAGATRVVRAG